MPEERVRSKLVQPESSKAVIKINATMEIPVPFNIARKLIDKRNTSPEERRSIIKEYVAKHIADGNCVFNDSYKVIKIK